MNTRGLKLKQPKIIDIMKRKEYLGDGVYVLIDEDGRIVLTTENGLETTNTIYLEPEVVKNLIEYLET